MAWGLSHLGLRSGTARTQCAGIKQEFALDPGASSRAAWGPGRPGGPAAWQAQGCSWPQGEKLLSAPGPRSHQDVSTGQGACGLGENLHPARPVPAAGPGLLAPELRSASDVGPGAQQATLSHVMRWPRGPGPAALGPLWGTRQVWSTRGLLETHTLCPQQGQCWGSQAARLWGHTGLQTSCARGQLSSRSSCWGAEQGASLVMVPAMPCCDHPSSSPAPRPWVQPSLAWERDLGLHGLSGRGPPHVWDVGLFVSVNPPCSRHSWVVAACHTLPSHLPTQLGRRASSCWLMLWRHGAGVWPWPGVPPPTARWAPSSMHHEGTAHVWKVSWFILACDLLQQRLKEAHTHLHPCGGAGEPCVGVLEPSHPSLLSSCACAWLASLDDLSPFRAPVPLDCTGGLPCRLLPQMGPPCGQCQSGSQTLLLPPATQGPREWGPVLGS